MTTINRICFELSDVLAIRLQCKHCGAAISYPTDNWKPGFLKCPNCPATLVTKPSEGESKELHALASLANALKELSKPDTFEFRLRFEFAQSSSA